MSFEATSQDSRDPNSPQWGYVKVKNPEGQLFYPAKDDEWNEYVLFVHDNDNDKKIRSKDSKTTEIRKIPARTDLECIMVPATLTIDCNKEQVLELMEKDKNNCGDPEMVKCYEAYIERLKGIELPAEPITINRTIPDSTTLWVALVLGSAD
jgi:hypothetical protein